MAIDWTLISGLVAGVIAGFAARYGTMCTMGAIEDGLIGRDFRGAKAWGLAIAVAIATTQLSVALGYLDLSHSLYLGSKITLFAPLLGGLMFGLGMSLTGTCGFGLLVRAGGGDLRAAVSAIAVGIWAMAVTAGLLAPLRLMIIDRGMMDLASVGGATLPGLARHYLGSWLAAAIAPVIALVLIAVAATDPGLRRRPRMVASAILLGLAILAGWLGTATAVEHLELDRPESLSFVAPTGRALLQLMMDPFRNVAFGVAAAFGVVVASFVVAWWRRDFRWEAFDDPLEMRRHMAGSALMGFGGVLAQGCTIGQGLSAASTLAISAPIFLVSVIAGAKLGLLHLLEGHASWRRPPRR